MINLKKEILDELRRYEARKQSISSLRNRISMLADNFGRLRRAQANVDPVQGGGSYMEEHLLNNMVEKDRLMENLRVTSKVVKWLEQGLNTLTAEERLVLEYFYINRLEGYREILCERLSVEQSKLYHLKDQALEKLTRVLYGG